MLDEKRNAKRKTRIAVAGSGYVGISIAVLLARSYEVCTVDVVPERLEKIAQRVSPIADREIEAAFAEPTFHLNATLDAERAYREADCVIVAVPTNYDKSLDSFDTSIVERVVRQVKAANPEALVVIKSTVPVGYTKQLCECLGWRNILFSPEFLREGHALFDNLYPSRIIVGVDPSDSWMMEQARLFAELLYNSARKEEVPVLLIGSAEAEAIKLFANTYLAMRVSFFNELDTYAEEKGLDARQIIDGVCLDARIGGGYNNPSFGYGGYCLPKDTKQLLSNYAHVPQRLIRAVVESNDARKDHVVREVLRRLERNGEAHPIVGIYRLTMKMDSDNFRQSAVRDVILRLRERGVEVLIHEPILGEMQEFEGCPVENNFARFAARSTLIVANRKDRILTEVENKLYTRDLFERD